MNVTRNRDAGGPHNDLVRRPVSALLWWCLPIVLALATETLRLPARELATVWCAAFAWMATGCIVNAYRCHRLHCYISGPAFLAGAVACGLLAMGILANGRNTLSLITAGTIVVALASFLPEMFWSRYV